MNERTNEQYVFLGLGNTRLVFLSPKCPEHSDEQQNADLADSFSQTARMSQGFYLCG